MRNAERHIRDLATGRVYQTHKIVVIHPQVETTRALISKIHCTRRNPIISQFLYFFILLYFALFIPAEREKKILIALLLPSMEIESDIDFVRCVNIYMLFFEGRARGWRP